MIKYLITFNEFEVVTISEHHGGTVHSGINALITTLDNAFTALASIGVDTSMISQKKEAIKLEEESLQIQQENEN